MTTSSSTRPTSTRRASSTLSIGSQGSVMESSSNARSTKQLIQQINNYHLPGSFSGNGSQLLSPNNSANNTPRQHALASQPAAATTTRTTSSTKSLLASSSFPATEVLGGGSTQNAPPKSSESSSNPTNNRKPNASMSSRIAAHSYHNSSSYSSAAVQARITKKRHERLGGVGETSYSPQPTADDSGISSRVVGPGMLFQPIHRPHSSPTRSPAFSATEDRPLSGQHSAHTTSTAPHHPSATVKSSSGSPSHSNLSMAGRPPISGTTRGNAFVGGSTSPSSSMAGPSTPSPTASTSLALFTTPNRSLNAFSIASVAVGSSMMSLTSSRASLMSPASLSSTEIVPSRPHAGSRRSTGAFASPSSNRKHRSGSASPAAPPLLHRSSSPASPPTPNAAVQHVSKILFPTHESTASPTPVGTAQSPHCEPRAAAWGHESLHPGGLLGGAHTLLPVVVPPGGSGATSARDTVMPFLSYAPHSGLVSVPTPTMSLSSGPSFPITGAPLQRQPHSPHPHMEDAVAIERSSLSTPSATTDALHLSSQRLPVGAAGAGEEKHEPPGGSSKGGGLLLLDTTPRTPSTSVSTHVPSPRMVSGAPLPPSAVAPAGEMGKQSAPTYATSKVADNLRRTLAQAEAVGKDNASEQGERRDSRTTTPVAIPCAPSTSTTGAPTMAEAAVKQREASVEKQKTNISLSLEFSSSSSSASSAVPLDDLADKQLLTGRLPPHSNENEQKTNKDYHSSSSAHPSHLEEACSAPLSRDNATATTTTVKKVPDSAAQHNTFLTPAMEPSSRSTFILGPSTAAALVSPTPPSRTHATALPAPRVLSSSSTPIALTTPAPVPSTTAPAVPNESTALQASNGIKSCVPASASTDTNNSSTPVSNQSSSSARDRAMSARVPPLWDILREEKGAPTTSGSPSHTSSADSNGVTVDAGAPTNNTTTNHRNNNDNDNSAAPPQRFIWMGNTSMNLAPTPRCSVQVGSSISSRSSNRPSTAQENNRTQQPPSPFTTTTSPATRTPVVHFHQGITTNPNSSSGAATSASDVQPQPSPPPSMPSSCGQSASSTSPVLRVSNSCRTISTGVEGSDSTRVARKLDPFTSNPSAPIQKKPVPVLHRNHNTMNNSVNGSHSTPSSTSAAPSASTPVPALPAASNSATVGGATSPSSKAAAYEPTPTPPTVAPRSPVAPVSPHRVALAATRAIPLHGTGAPSVRLGSGPRTATTTMRTEPTPVAGGPVISPTRQILAASLSPSPVHPTTRSATPAPTAPVTWVSASISPPQRASGSSNATRTPSTSTANATPSPSPASTTTSGRSRTVSANGVVESSVKTSVKKRASSDTKCVVTISATRIVAKTEEPSHTNAFSDSATSSSSRQNSPGLSSNPPSPTTQQRATQDVSIPSSKSTAAAAKAAPSPTPTTTTTPPAFTVQEVPGKNHSDSTTTATVVGPPSTPTPFTVGSTAHTALSPAGSAKTITTPAAGTNSNPTKVAKPTPGKENPDAAAASSTTTKLTPSSQKQAAPAMTAPGGSTTLAPPPPPPLRRNPLSQNALPSIRTPTAANGTGKSVATVVSTNHPESPAASHQTHHSKAASGKPPMAPSGGSTRRSASTFPGAAPSSDTSNTKTATPDTTKVSTHPHASITPLTAAVAPTMNPPPSSSPTPAVGARNAEPAVTAATTLTAAPARRPMPSPSAPPPPSQPMAGKTTGASAPPTPQKASLTPSAVPAVALSPNTAKHRCSSSSVDPTATATNHSSTTPLPTAPLLGQPFNSNSSRGPLNSHHHNGSKQFQLLLDDEDEEDNGRGSRHQRGNDDGTTREGGASSQEPSSATRGKPSTSSSTSADNTQDDAAKKDTTSATRRGSRSSSPNKSSTRGSSAEKQSGKNKDSPSTRSSNSSTASGRGSGSPLARVSSPSSTAFAPGSGAHTAHSKRLSNQYSDSTVVNSHEDESTDDEDYDDPKPFFPEGFDRKRGARKRNHITFLMPAAEKEELEADSRRPPPPGHHPPPLSAVLLFEEGRCPYEHQKALYSRVHKPAGSNVIIPKGGGILRSTSSAYAARPGYVKVPALPDSFGRGFEEDRACRQRPITCQVEQTSVLLGYRGEKEKEKMNCGTTIS